MTANLNTKLEFTTIQPAESMLYAELPQRSKEGEAEKPNLFVLISLPSALENIQNPEIKSFCTRAYIEAVKNVAAKAKKDGLIEFHAPSLEECFTRSGKREFLLTKKDLTAWLDEFAFALINAAFAAKMSLHPDSPKVVKRALKVKDTVLEMTARGRAPMDQESIDVLLRVATLAEEAEKQGKVHAYTDNFLQGIARMQTKLDTYQAEDEEDEDIGADSF